MLLLEFLDKFFDGEFTIVVLGVILLQQISYLLFSYCLAFKEEENVEEFHG